MAVVAAPVRPVITAPRESVFATTHAPLVRQPIWPAEVLSELRPAPPPSIDVRMLGVLYGRSSG